MNSRRIAATRRLAHLLLERAVSGRAATPDAAARLLDTRLVPTREGQRRAVEEAISLCRAATLALERDGALRGELRTNLRIAVRGREGAPFTVVVPSAVFSPDGSAAALVMAPEGDRGAAARARRYRFALRSLAGTTAESGPRAAACIVRPDGAVTDLDAIDSEPRGAPSRDSECSPSARSQSGRTPR